MKRDLYPEGLCKEEREPPVATHPTRMHDVVDWFHCIYGPVTPAIYSTITIAGIITDRKGR